MSVIAWPSLKVSSFRWKLQEAAVPFVSTFGSQALVTGVPTWAAEMAGVPMYWDEAEQVATFLESLRGYTNQIALHHLANALPRGSLRGFPVLGEAAPRGSVVMNVAAGLAQVGASLRQGDMLGIGSNFTRQLVRVAADAEVDADGLIEVHLVTPLRSDFSVGQAIDWNRPHALFRQSSLQDGMQYEPVVGRPWSLSLVEDWRT